jgi:hypothetical protein
MTPEPRQAEKKADHEQEHVHMNRHNDLVAKNGEKGELLEKQGYGESTMLSSKRDKSPNYPPPSEGVPAESGDRQAPPGPGVERRLCR